MTRRAGSFANARIAPRATHVFPDPNSPNSNAVSPGLPSKVPRQAPTYSVASAPPCRRTRTADSLAVIRASTASLPVSVSPEGSERGSTRTWHAGRISRLELISRVHARPAVEQGVATAEAAEYLRRLACRHNISGDIIRENRVRWWCFSAHRVCHVVATQAIVGHCSHDSIDTNQNGGRSR